MIDLRSDTLTRPTAGMREAMAQAPVGDDVYGEDPSVAALESRVAALLGHEAGLYCATGSLANVLGVAVHVAPGQEVLCDSGAHIARAEMGAHGALSGVTMRTWVTPDGRVTPDQVEALLAPDAGPYLVSTACVELENTHNFGGGTVQPWDVLVRTTGLVRDAGVALHLDGARLWNAHVATGIGLGEYGALFDTVSVCFSKGLGAPIGSVLVGSADAMARA
ncbi:MAG TPA: threonine aldolase family protein, partial [Propioniciclava sp.]|uniref:threonine aldolase family protein n=2 Tax=Propioniciclava sp. TaxID=2038686 RepID=UPI002C35FD70